MITCEYSRHLKVIKDDPRKSSVRLFLYFGAAKARVTLSLTLPPPPPPPQREMPLCIHYA